MTRKAAPVALGITCCSSQARRKRARAITLEMGSWSLQRLSPVERTQYSSSGQRGSSNCWDLYQTNCPVPHETNPIQDLAGHSGYPGAPNHLYGGGAPSAGLSSGGAHVYPGGVPALHDFGGAGAGLHGLGSGGVPASPGFTADAPAFHGLEGLRVFMALAARQASMAAAVGLSQSVDTAASGIVEPVSGSAAMPSPKRLAGAFALRSGAIGFLALCRVEQREGADQGDDDAAERDFRRAG